MKNSSCFAFYIFCWGVVGDGGRWGKFKLGEVGRSGSIRGAFYLYSVISAELISNPLLFTCTGMREVWLMYGINMLLYSFQNILKFSTCFFTVFRTYWNFQHAFLQFSEHAENFNMLFYSFKHSFSICFQHALQISTCYEIFNTL